MHVPHKLDDNSHLKDAREYELERISYESGLWAGFWLALLVVFVIIGVWLGAMAVL